MGGLEPPTGKVSKMTLIHFFFKDRFALAIGIYLGSWGLHFYLDLGPFTIGFEIPLSKEVSK